MESIDGANKKPSKAQQRSLSPSAFRKPCSICQEANDILVRCQIDKTDKWHLVCPKRCWKDVSGGVVDGSMEHPYYRYGGMWKNKHAMVSAKKPKATKKAAQIAKSKDTEDAT